MMSYNRPAHGRSGGITLRRIKVMQGYSALAYFSALPPPFLLHSHLSFLKPFFFSIEKKKKNPQDAPKFIHGRIPRI